MLDEMLRTAGGDAIALASIRVNGRRVYWASHDPIPGGPAFENFELRQRYSPDQIFIFGLTTEEPGEFQPSIPHLPKEQ